MKCASVIFVLCLVSRFALAEEPLQWFEERTPWGDFENRYQYYLKDGEKIQHGIDESFYCSGSIMSRSNYIHGLLHGKQESFYEHDGALETLCYRIQGQWHGPWIEYSVDGKVLFEGVYQDGRPYQGRCSTTGSSTVDPLIANNVSETFLYKEGKKVAGSKKEITNRFLKDLPETGPNWSKFIKWPYIWQPIDAPYPYPNQLPQIQKIPFLIEWCRNKKERYSLANAQLKTLSRCEFDQIDDWSEWWNRYGKQLEINRTKHGKKDNSAWKLACLGRTIPIPKNAIYLPTNYSVRFTFRSGDYGCICEEDMTLKRTANSAELIREF